MYGRLREHGGERNFLLLVFCVFPQMKMRLYFQAARALAGARFGSGTAGTPAALGAASGGGAFSAPLRYQNVCALRTAGFNPSCAQLRIFRTLQINPSGKKNGCAGLRRFSLSGHGRNRKIFEDSVFTPGASAFAETALPRFVFRFGGCRFYAVFLFSVVFCGI